jgi:anti-sigma factor RsiW
MNHVESLLLPYHLGHIEDHERAEVEHHLVTCERCLLSFLALKRQLDLAGASEVRPAVDVRFRLRAAVAEKLPRKRTLPLRLVLAGAAAAGAFSFFIWLQSRDQNPHSASPQSGQHELIDTGADPHPSAI